MSWNLYKSDLKTALVSQIRGVSDFSDYVMRTVALIIFEGLYKLRESESMTVFSHFRSTARFIACKVAQASAEKIDVPAGSLCLILRLMKGTYMPDLTVSPWLVTEPSVKTCIKSPNSPLINSKRNGRIACRLFLSGSLAN
jgi:hypothetical protein